MTSSLLLFACASPANKSALAAPSSLEVFTELPTPTLVAPPAPKRVTGPLWTLCKDGQSFCLSLDQGKEIRLRYSKEIARLNIEAVDAQEKLGKALVREQEAEALLRRAQIIGIGLGIGGLVFGLVVGGLVGHYLIP